MLTESEESVTVIEPLNIGQTPSKKRKTVTLGSRLSHHSSESTTGSAIVPCVIHYKEKIRKEMELYAALITRLTR